MVGSSHVVFSFWVARVLARSKCVGVLIFLREVNTVLLAHKHITVLYEIWNIALYHIIFCLLVAISVQRLHVVNLAVPLLAKLGH